MFLVGTAFRIRNYLAVFGLIFTFSNRWPKLLELAKQHSTVFLRWPTLLPIGVTLAVMLANILASQFVWDDARITLEDLQGRWIAVLTVVLSGIIMVALDCKAVFGFGRFDRAALEENLDKAEHWLKTWKAPALRFLTLGLINPRKLVNDQVRESLIKASLNINGQMWRWTLQIAGRLVFGLAVWTSWATG